MDITRDEDGDIIRFPLTAATTGLLGRGDLLLRLDFAGPPTEPSGGTLQSLHLQLSLSERQAREMAAAPLGQADLMAAIPPAQQQH